MMAVVLNSNFCGLEGLVSSFEPFIVLEWPNEILYIGIWEHSKNETVDSLV